MFDRTTPQISIVIPSWFKNGQHGKYGKHETFWFAVECLERLLKTIENERYRYEIILVDNGSSLTSKDLDASLYLTGEFPAVRTEDLEPEDRYAVCSAVSERFSPELYWGKADVLVRNPKNLGFAPAINQGLALARGEYSCCINNDVLVWPGWADALLEPFVHIDEDGYTKAGVVMPALAHDTRDASKALSIEEVDLSANRDKIGPKAEFGSMWMAPTKLLREVAKFRDGYQIMDEEFKLGMGEDRLLWAEIRQLGYETYRSHRTRVFHQGNMSIGKVPDRKAYTTKNRERLARIKEERGIK